MTLLEKSVLIILLVIILLAYFQLGNNSVEKISMKFCSKSLEESENYICESDSKWLERKRIHENQDKLNLNENKTETLHPNLFTTNWEPSFHCSHAERIGHGDGGKWVCDWHRIKSRGDCLVYSVGSKGEFSFEIHLKERLPNCEIHTFDKNLYQCPNNICQFHQMKFGNGSGSGTKSWGDVIQKLNHRRRRIDILKIDIDGSEFETVPTIFNYDHTSFPRQFLLEIHHETTNKTQKIFHLLRQNHYVIFSKETNFLCKKICYEYSFLKLNERFFQSY